MHCGKHINTNTETTNLSANCANVRNAYRRQEGSRKKNPINHEKIIKKSWMLAINQSGI